MYADTVSELLSAVIPGYDELPSNENGDEAAFVARYEAAIELANLVQTGLVIDATENDGRSPEQVTEDELNALFQSKVVPFVPCEGADGTVSAERQPCRSCGRRRQASMALRVGANIVDDETSARLAAIVLGSRSADCSSGSRTPGPSRGGRHERIRGPTARPLLRGDLRRSGSGHRQGGAEMAPRRDRQSKASGCRPDTAHKFPSVDIRRSCQ